MSCSRSPFGTIRLPEGALEEIDSVVDSKGRTCRRYRIRGMPDDFPVLTQYHMDLIDIGEVKIEPMKMPVASVFYTNYTYGKDRNETK